MTVKSNTTEMDKEITFHFLELTVLNSMLLLTSCNTKITHRTPDVPSCEIISY